MSCVKSVKISFPFTKVIYYINYTLIINILSTDINKGDDPPIVQRPYTLSLKHTQ